MPGYGEKLIQLWNDWQLSAVVLLSLSLQLLLLCTGGFRSRTTPSCRSKFYFWALYIVSSPISIYALGILSRASAGHADADIQAFWAVLLLNHLGGVDDYTALSLEDNELWVRRLFGLSIQVTTTAYVFVRYCKDDGFQRFLAPFGLLFLVGLLKCGEQVAALWQATMQALMESVLGIPDPGPDYADTMDRVDGVLRSGGLPHLNIDNERVDPPSSPGETPSRDNNLEAYDKKDRRQAVKLVRSAHLLFRTFKVLFADGIFSFKDRRDSRAEFSKKGKDWAFKVVETELSFVYDQLYTKASVSRTKLGLPIRVASLLLTLAGSIWTLFVTLHASQYRLRHRWVTFTLLAGAVFTDVVILAYHSLSIWTLVHKDWLPYSCVFVNCRRWSGHMAQSNLIKFCLQKLPSESKLDAFIRNNLATRRHINFDRVMYPVTPALLAAMVAPKIGNLLKPKRTLVDKLLARSFWSKYKQIEHVLVREELKDFIFCEIRKKEEDLYAWERQEKAASKTLDNHNPFTAYRGDGVMLSEKITGLDWSLQEKEFDESLLVWHIATDLCFRQEDKQGNTCGEPMKIARELSNYLFYIMVVHPLMLSPPTTMATKRCRDTCAEARRHFLKENLQLRQRLTREARSEMAMGEDNAHKFLLKVKTPLPASVMKGDKSKSVLWDGCFLAKELTRIMEDPEKKWQVVSKVWAEMLCYAAIHCGGYQHAERLKEGGELITFVCLLMTHLGMGKHYRTEVGDTYAHITAYTA